MFSFLNKYFFIPLLIVVTFQSATAQLNLNDFKNFKFGTSFQDSMERNKIINSVCGENKNYDVYQGDFLKTHDIEIDHSPFDYYGDVNYLLQYVKDTLTCIKVENKYSAYKIDNFSRFIKQIYADLNSHFQRTNNATFDIANMIKIAAKECKESSRGHDQILGHSSWSVNDKRIFVEVEIKSGDYSEYNYNSREFENTYKGL